MGKARVQGNCAAVNELRKTIEIEGEEGEGVQVEVFYENIPLQCLHCKVFGHSTGQCLKHNGVRKGRSCSRAGRGKRSSKISVERGQVGNPTKPTQAEQCALEWKQMGVQEKGENSRGLIGINRLEVGPVPLMFNERSDILTDMPITISKEFIGPEFNRQNDWSLVPFQASETNYFEALEEEDLADDSGEESINEPSKMVGEMEAGDEIVSIHEDEQQMEEHMPLLLTNVEDTQCPSLDGGHLVGTTSNSLGDLRAMVTIEALANSRIGPKATVADVLNGQDWEEFCGGNTQVLAKDVFTIICRLRTATFWHNIGVSNVGPITYLMCNEYEEMSGKTWKEC
ncbi:hypothetical protein MLD38_035115 [Melastoma candidum]|nr:hypothetical protein MLD38_035115 [Melastoma candidum]